MGSSEWPETTLAVAVLALLATVCVTLWQRDPADDLRVDAMFSGDRRHLVQASRSELQVVDVRDGRTTCRIALDDPAVFAVNILHPLPGGDALIDVDRSTANGREKTLWRLKPSEGRLEPLDLPGMPARLDAARVADLAARDGSYLTAYMPDGRRLPDGMMHYYPATGEPVWAPEPNPEAGPGRIFRMDPGVSRGGHALARMYGIVTNPTQVMPSRWSLTVWSLPDGRVLHGRDGLPALLGPTTVHDNGSVAGFWFPPAGGVRVVPGGGGGLRPPPGLWVSRPGEPLRLAMLPAWLEMPGQLVFSPDGRYVVLVGRETETVTVAGRAFPIPAASGICLYDMQAHRVVRSWRPLAAAGGLALRFAGDARLLLASHRSGAVFEVALDGGPVHRLFAVRPPSLTGRAGWFPSTAAALLLLWTAVWVGRIRFGHGDRATTAWRVSLLLAVGWLAVRLLSEMLTLTVPSLWPVLPSAWLANIDTVLATRSGHRLAGLLTLPTVLVMALATAWLNRGRVGRLFWLTVLSAFCGTIACHDAAALLGVERIPAPWRQAG